MGVKFGSQRRVRPLVEALDARLLLRTIYVDANRPPGNGASWQFPMQGLDSAIGIAAPGDQIRVADGTYKPTLGTDRNISFILKQGVEILGGFAGFGAPDPDARDVNLYPSILSGDIGAAGAVFDNSFHVVTGSGVNTTAILDGFTITAGYAINGGDRGAGILIQNGSPTIRNCTITNNRASIQGDGMYVGGASPTLLSSPVITGCRFINNGLQGQGNNSGGAIYAEFSVLTITNTVFEGNAAYIGAGGVHSVRSNVTLTGCTFINNWARYGGAAISFEFGTFATVNNCTFSGNTTQLSGTVSNRGSAQFSTNSTFTNCTFTANTADRGGAFMNDLSATLTADHCTFTRNTATSSGGAVWAWGKVGLTNSRFYGNAVVPQSPGGVGDGGAVTTNASSTGTRGFIVNCEFVGNRAPYGGALADLGAAGSTVHNCTFVANAATNTGGAYNPGSNGGSGSPARLVNGIFWNNVAPKAGQIGGTPSVSWSDVQDGFSPGAGNINADPVFVRNPAAGADNNWGTPDDNYGDLRLQIQSPCIDAASFADVAANYPTDIVGHERRFDFPGVFPARPAPDMGAHELGMRLGLLRVPDGQTLALPTGGHTFIVEQLSIGAGATLDIADDSLAIEYAAASPAGNVESLVRSGYNVTGDWLGTGITSSVAALDGNYAVGVADNASLAAPFGAAQGGPLFDGVDVDLTTVLVKFTHRADLNLDGRITADDAAIFGGNYDEDDPATWATGDLNFDGLFTADDSAIFGANYDETLPPV